MPKAQRRSQAGLKGSKPAQRTKTTKSGTGGLPRFLDKVQCVLFSALGWVAVLQVLVQYSAVKEVELQCDAVQCIELSYTAVQNQLVGN